MPSDREIFNLSGPTHLTAVDWTNAHHRRSVAASLVHGVYILEPDRQQNRHGPQALAPPWWNVFHFQLNQVLTDEVDISLFRAVYEFQYPTDPALNIPKYVAFGGAILKPDTRSQDFKLDLQCIRNKLHQSPRFQVAMQTVQNIVALAGAPNVWLTGHSLGSAIALLAGKNMSKCGYFLESYLFNPPFLSVDPLERIKDERVKYGIRFAKSVLKAGLTHALQASQHQKSREHDPFAMLSHWIPYLFVNPADHICRVY
ncbi:hypothetical protein CJ030_MR7G016700 [Morella rubra]|uniref:Fungal lipase-type domain-containing protein n=1 Tax=Morella rubra TaxID=262757 RepID=A0A6A1UY70_9ROSI|nr:hypothetical protein CJ030_MR7G016700 [Morella rubra]